MFSMPDPSLVKASPAERLVDRATSAESAQQAMPAGTTARPVPLPVPVKFDRQAVDQVYRLLTDPDLSFLSHGALMFFTVREFSRYQRHNCPFSVVRFELDVVSGTHWEPMPRPLVKDVCKQLFSVMRPLDLIGHYDGNDYAILLPHTPRDEALGVTRRLHELLSSISAGPGLAPGQSQIFCGVACVPDDCQHPGVALAAALEARNKAKAIGRAYVAFSELSQLG
jgi:diguanylate cyclase (GGDEF)-like protein